MSSKIDLLEAEYLFELQGQKFILNVDKSMFWQDESTLLLSDLHLGKAGHFRKNGIPIPREVHFTDFQKMNSLIERYEAQRIIFLGDLFHSESNDEWHDLVYWSNFHSKVEQVLVVGNHDKLTRDQYAGTSMTLYDNYVKGPFEFTHETEETKAYNISGHIHPSIRLQGLARQGVTLPCFYFGSTFGLLPAFGAFTGSHAINPQKGDRVFAIAEGKLVSFIP